uniref:Uncharacterized protein n=1 Tax=uncultured bacterium 5E7 TaxID=1701324 RepID=A0A166H2D1_9BACT|nr:hypothetical protein 5E7_032 [uncultured bacterium 5E7]
MVQSSTGFSMKGYCAMGESLTQQRRVWDDAFRGVNHFSQGRRM